MSRLSIFVTLLLTSMASMVYAIEPSNIIVTINGKSYHKHLVEKGQTLYSIAKAYNVSEKQIKESNMGLTAETLKADDYILVPRVVSDDGKYKALNSSSQQADKKIFIFHTVSTGDTLYSIARKYKISIAQLEKDNPDIDIDNIQVGDIINVRRAERGYVTSDDIARELELRAERNGNQLQSDEHRVVAGETVFSLSRAYGISEEEFMKLNGLSSYSDLKVGMVVKIKAGDKQAAAEMVDDEDNNREKRGEKRRQRDMERDAEDAAIADTLTLQYDDTTTLLDTLQNENVEIAPMNVTFPPLSLHHTLKVALMLPFHMNEKVNPYFVDFYRGVLIAMEDLKNEGYDIELAVFDTYGSGEKINDIINYEDGLREAQLIIGPVYEGELRYVVGFAEENEIPVVSPLADITSLQSPVLFQMQAENSYKYDKLKEIFDGSRDIVTIYANTVDSDFISEIQSLSSSANTIDLNYKFDRGSFFYRRNADGTSGAEIDIVEFMRTQSSKAYVIAAKSDTDVDRILTTLASTKASVVARSMSYGDYIVVGNRKWKQSSTIEKQSFFRNDVIFISPYYANRSNENVRIFDSRYVKAYGALPTMYSYRGYDAAIIFCRKMFDGIDGRILEQTFTPLATPYNFLYEDGYYLNNNWIKEHYNSNFTITVE